MPARPTPARYRASVLIAIAVLIVATGLAILQPQQLHHPLLKIDVPTAESRFGLSVLLDGVDTNEHCEQLLGNAAASILAACPQCTTIERACLTTLTEEQQLLLSEDPLTNFSARLPKGLTLYESSDHAIARASCEESERQAATIGLGVKCYPPGVERPRLTASQPSVSSNGWQKRELWLAVALAAFGFLVFQLARPLVPALGTFALNLPRRDKQVILLLADIASIELTLWAALAIRLETVFVPVSPLLPLFLISPLIAFPIFIRFGLYRAVVRYLGLHALGTIAKAVLLYTAALAAAAYFLALPQVPRSIPLIHGALAMLLIGSTRALARHWLSHAHASQIPIDRRKRVLIYGAGAAGVQLATALLHCREMLPVAMMDDDPALANKQIAALTVYAPDKLPALIERHGVSEVLLALPSVSRTKRNEIISRLEPLPVLVRTLPGVAELAEGKVTVSDLREVDIEDLLGRDPVPPNPELLGANITGKAVMVTGAGGSIGSELCRQIVSLKPRALVLFENSEFALYAIEQELLRRNLSIPLYPILGSVTDQPRLERVIRAFGVQTVFHAAAYKHVPMVEKNPIPGAINNIFGTWHAAQAALNTGVATFVLISTDKAVRPTNTMGTTKRFAELILQVLHQHYPDKTRFTMVRFGNVLGSSGSVVPLFREQVRRGGPVTVTDPGIIRYFMTIPEAAQLVIQAGAMGRGSDVFVLDMGEPVKIIDLARRMIHLSGLTERSPDNPSGDIEIVFSGLRPGEKLYEELLIGDNVMPTAHPRIMRANEKMLGWKEVQNLLGELKRACDAGDSEQVRALLTDAVDEFQPQCGNEDLLGNVGKQVLKRIDHLARVPG